MPSSKRRFFLSSLPPWLPTQHFLSKGLGSLNKRPLHVQGIDGKFALCGQIIRSAAGGGDSAAAEGS
jgi:hypothetical protein